MKSSSKIFQFKDFYILHYSTFKYWLNYNTNVSLYNKNNPTDQVEHKYVKKNQKYLKRQLFLDNTKPR